MARRPNIARDLLLLIRRRAAQPGDHVSEIEAVNELMVELTSYRDHLMSAPARPAPRRAVAPDDQGPDMRGSLVGKLQESAQRQAKDLRRRLQDERESRRDIEMDDDDDDDSQGGAGGVREPRRPIIGPDTGSIALQPPTV